MVTRNLSQPVASNELQGDVWSLSGIDEAEFGQDPGRQAVNGYPAIGGVEAGRDRLTAGGIEATCCRASETRTNQRLKGNPIRIIRHHRARVFFVMSFWKMVDFVQVSYIWCLFQGSPIWWCIAIWTRAPTHSWRRILGWIRQDRDGDYIVIWGCPIVPFDPSSSGRLHNDDPFANLDVCSLFYDTWILKSSI